MAYDFVVVGAGMFGASFARTVADRGKKVLVIDRKPHVGGMCFTEIVSGVVVHKYGPHVFHTSNPAIWAFVNRFAEWRQFMVRTKAVLGQSVYTLPFCLSTFHQLWGVTTPQEARRKLASVRVPIENPANMEEWALSQLGEEIYSKFVYHYSKRQWGREPRDLPAAILQRLPIRMTFDDNYFVDRWQGVPAGGYTAMFHRMLEGIEVRLGCDYFEDRGAFDRLGQVVYSGRVDRFHDYALGRLSFRGCKFEQKVFSGDFQGNPVIHHLDPEVTWTRTIEHKHFENPGAESSPVTWETPFECDAADEPFYPVNDAANNALYDGYAALQRRAVFGGRSGTYRYLDMCEVIAQAWKLAGTLC
jgi:UDP-galactopyranose mutase